MTAAVLEGADVVNPASGRSFGGWRHYLLADGRELRRAFIGRPWTVPAFAERAKAVLWRRGTWEAAEAAPGAFAEPKAGVFGGLEASNQGELL